MKKSDKESWIQEYAEFEKQSSFNVAVPSHLFPVTKKRLFPNPWTVFGKVAVFHVIVGFLSLAVCNQFGLNPFNMPYSLSDFFMKTAGHSVCMVLCGVLFVSLTYLLANIFLTLEELESIRRHEWLQLTILSLFSIFVFYFLGADLVVAFVLLWFIGALIGGFFTIEWSFKLRNLMVNLGI